MLKLKRTGRNGRCRFLLCSIFLEGFINIVFFFSFISIGGENLGHGVLGFSCRLLHGHVAGIGAGKIIFISRLVHVLGFKFFKDKSLCGTS